MNETLKLIKPGVMITIEGPSGAGKTILVNHIVDELKKSGHTCQEVEYPLKNVIWITK